ncbi:MAG: hypothetical protein WCI51_22990, partial [Lentisphaerota bacterium]
KKIFHLSRRVSDCLVPFLSIVIAGLAVSWGISQLSHSIHCRNIINDGFGMVFFRLQTNAVFLPEQYSSDNAYWHYSPWMSAAFSA